jgi:hypothetical protein
MRFSSGSFALHTANRLLMDRRALTAAQLIAHFRLC